MSKCPNHIASTLLPVVGILFHSPLEVRIPVLYNGKRHKGFTRGGWDLWHAQAKAGRVIEKVFQHSLTELLVIICAGLQRKLANKIGFQFSLHCYLPLPVFAVLLLTLVQWIFQSVLCGRSLVHQIPFRLHVSPARDSFSAALS